MEFSFDQPTYEDMQKQLKDTGLLAMRIEKVKRDWLAEPEDSRFQNILIDFTGAESKVIREALGFPDDTTEMMKEVLTYMEDADSFGDEHFFRKMFAVNYVQFIDSGNPLLKEYEAYL